MFLGTAKCTNKSELFSALENLATIKGTSLEMRGLELAVMYEPEIADREAEDKAITEIMKILSDIPVHGSCTI